MTAPGTPEGGIGFPVPPSPEDASYAFDDMRLVRVQVAHDGAGAGLSRVRYVYLWENTSTERDHRVIPLLPLTRDVFHNMRVTGGKGGQLVYLSSEFSRDALLAWAERLRTRLVGHLVEAPLDPARRDDLVAGVSTVDLQITFKPDRSTPEQDVRDGFEWASGTFSAIFYELTSKSEEIEGNPALDGALEACGSILRSIQMRDSRYVPFIVLDEPACRQGSKRGPSVLLVRQELERGPRSIDTQGLSFFQRWQRRVLETLGVTTARVDFPIVTEAFSYHMRVLPCKGLMLGRRRKHDKKLAVRALNFDDAVFQGHNEGPRGASYANVSEEGMHLYRRGQQIEAYDDEILEREQEEIDEGIAENERLPHRAIWLEVNLKEPIGLVTLFLAGLAFSTATAVQDLVGGQSTFTFISATFAAVAAVIAQSFEKPFSQRVMPRRVVIMLLPMLGLVAWLLVQWLWVNVGGPAGAWLQDQVLSEIQHAGDSMRNITNASGTNASNVSA